MIATQRLRGAECVVGFAHRGRRRRDDGCRSLLHLWWREHSPVLGRAREARADLGPDPMEAGKAASFIAMSQAPRPAAFITNLLVSCISLSPPTRSLYPSPDGNWAIPTTGACKARTAP